MVEVPKQFIVRLNKRVGFYETGTISAYGIFQAIGRIHPMSVTIPLQLQIWFGQIEFPADSDRFEIYLIAADVNQIPDVSSVRVTAEWQAATNWQRLGDPLVGVTAVQTIAHENILLVSGAKGNIELADRVRDYQWVLVVLPSAGMDVLVMGSFAYAVDLLQRTWRADNYTWALSDPGTRNNRGESAIDLGWY